MLSGFEALSGSVSVVSNAKVLPLKNLCDFVEFVGSAGL